MIYLFRSNNIFSSRVNKYVRFYEEGKIPYHVFGWDRNDEKLIKHNYSFFGYKCGYSVGGIKAVYNHLRWMSFVFLSLFRSNCVTTIHACDLNSAFPAAIYKLLFNKNVVLIFDVCDWFSSNFYKYKMLKHFFSIMERLTCKVADEIILCEPERVRQIQFKLSKEVLILPNIPYISSSDIFVKCDEFIFDNQNLTLSYFGGFSKDRFLEELLDLSKNMNFNLLIAGYGDFEIEKKCYEMSGLPNVRYFGKVDMKYGLKMSYNSDVIYAMYCVMNPNNIFAAPNKLYESMFLGKPIISNKGTILENKILDNNIGYIIDENIEDLKELINNIKKNDACDKGRKSNKLWERKYSNYVNLFFENIYSKKIKL